MAQQLLSLSYVHNAINRPFQNLTAGRLLDDVTRRFPNKEALVFLKDDTRKTFTELHHDVNQFAAGLLHLGLKPGDHVGIWADENYQWIMTDLAIETAGMVSVRLPRSLTTERLLQLLGKLDCKALVTSLVDSEAITCLKQIANDSVTTASQSGYSVDLSGLQYVISMSSMEDSWIMNYEYVLNLGSEIGAGKILEETKMLPDLDDPYAIVFTSGSTGLPKAVTLPNRRLEDDSFSMEYLFNVTTETIETEGLILPHVNTCTTGAYTFTEALMLVLGCTVVFPYHPNNTDALVDAIEKERCNVALLFPMYCVDIANNAEKYKNALNSLKYVQAVGNVFSPGVLKVVSSLLPGDIQQNYSSVEAGLMTGHSVDTNLEEKVSNVGFPAFHMEVKIVNVNTGRIAPIGTIGEVYVRGNGIFTCYWGDEEKTREGKTDDGWYRPGDLGKMDERGLLSIVGRKNDMIIKGAQNIYPSQIESVLCDHPKIKLQSVVAVPDKRLVNELCLCVVLQDGETATPDEFKEYLQNKIDDSCIPKYVLFMDTFPKTETSKIKRKELAKLAANILQLSTLE